MITQKELLQLSQLFVPIIDDQKKFQTEGARSFENECLSALLEEDDGAFNNIKQRIVQGEAKNFLLFPLQHLRDLNNIRSYYIVPESKVKSKMFSPDLRLLREILRQRVISLMNQSQLTQNTKDTHWLDAKKQKDIWMFLLITLLISPTILENLSPELGDQIFIHYENIQLLKQMGMDDTLVDHENFLSVLKWKPAQLEYALLIVDNVRDILDQQPSLELTTEFNKKNKDFSFAGRYISMMKFAGLSLPARNFLEENKAYIHHWLSHDKNTSANQLVDALVRENLCDENKINSFGYAFLHSISEVIELLAIHPAEINCLELFLLFNGNRKAWAVFCDRYWPLHSYLQQDPHVSLRDILTKVISALEQGNEFNELFVDRFFKEASHFLIAEPQYFSVAIILNGVFDTQITRAEIKGELIAAKKNTAASTVPAAELPFFARRTDPVEEINHSAQVAEGEKGCCLLL